MQNNLPQQSNNNEAEISTLLAQVDACVSWNDRLKQLIMAFMGRPYQLGPCGEGAKSEFDQQPIFRTDCFDCLSYVNLVLAMAHSLSPADFSAQIIDVNYRKTTAHFCNRLHFMSTDWLPHNIAADRLLLLSDKLGLPIATAKTIIDRAGWYAHLTTDVLHIEDASNHEEQQHCLQKLHSLGSHFVPESVSLPYLRLLDLLQHPESWLRMLPEVVLIVIVRPNWDCRKKIGTNLNISHVGFAVKEQNKFWFCHARQNESVQKVDLLQYLTLCKDSATIDGIGVYGLPETTNFLGSADAEHHE